MDGWKLHTHSDHRGQRTLGAELLPTRDPGAPQVTPPSWRRGPAVGLNRGRPDGAHGADNKSAAVCPPKPRHCWGQRTWASSDPAQTDAPCAAQSTGLRPVSGAHPRLMLLFSLAIELLVYWHPRHREDHLIPLLNRPCPL